MRSSVEALLIVFRLQSHSNILLSMEPSNDKERAIANVIESRCRQGGGCTYPAVLPEIIDSIDFLFSPKDTLFLLNYTKHRCSTPEQQTLFPSTLSNTQE